MVTVGSFDLGPEEFLTLGVEDVGAAFKEEHAENEVLELGRVHFAAENLGGGIEVAFEFGERER